MTIFGSMDISIDIRFYNLLKFQ